MNNLLAVSEVFYSLQGEGKTMGLPSVFLRLRACNLLCGGKGTIVDGKLHDNAKWRCDTIEVWTKGSKRDHREVLQPDQIQHLKNGAHLIITGGEPLLQQDAIWSYLNWFLTAYHFVPFIEVETNGTIQPDECLLGWVSLWNCSPKLMNSGVELNKRFRPEVLTVLNGLESIFKFVITEVGDIQEIRDLFFGLVDKEKIWLMPGASNLKQLMENNQMVAEAALIISVRFCTRLQIEIWNKTTGV